MRPIHTLMTYCSWILLLVLPFLAMGQQPWMQALRHQQDPSFYQIRQAFDNYWQGRVPAGKGQIPKGLGYKQYKRWEWFWEPRVGRSGQFPRPTVVMGEWNRYRATHPGAGKSAKGLRSLPGFPAPSASGSWVALGPASSKGGYSGVGRLSHIAFHPSDPNTFWVGSPSGGLWKTTTGGSSWTTLTDQLPVLGVSAVVIDPVNPDILYIATGDDNAASTYTVGVLKSTDGGSSWNPTGLSFHVFQTQLIKDLIIHPADPRVLLAATTQGIYRTADGAASWTREQPGYFQDMVFKPGDPATVYASGTDASGNSQIFRSTDNGDTWSQVTSFSSYSRIALAVTPANPSVVGALNADGDYYASVNSGASFGLVYARASGLNLLGYAQDGSDGGNQGWYDLCLAISPADADVIYTGGINTWKSTNGGKNWKINTMWYGGTGIPEVHADKHYMAFSPHDANTLYSCNDGGIYRSSDGGTSWTDLSNGLQITQFYRMGNSATNADLTIVGSQDNGTKIRNAATFTDVIGGDGMESIIDYSNADILYGSLYFGQIFRSADGGLSFTDISTSLPRGAWVTPYVIDPVDPQTLYAGLGQKVYKTTDSGDSWAAISDYLAIDHLQSLAVAPGNTQVIYAATYYELFKTTTGGGSWHKIALPAAGFVTSIEVHPSTPQVTWITYSGYQEGQKVFRTDDGGDSWTNISGTLPNLPANTLEYDKNTGTLYAGNDLGVFVRSPGMSDWQVFDTGLPNVVVTELEIQYSSGRLRAATYGRGLWESDLLPADAASLRWNYRFGGAGSDNFNTQIKTSDGGYLLGGYSSSGKSGDKSQPGRGKQDFWIVKISGTGTREWDQRYGGSGNDYLNAMVQTSDGGYLLGGNSQSGAGGDKSQSSRGKRDYWVVKISSTGIKEWDQRYGGSGEDDLRALIQLATGEFMLAGVSASGKGGDKSQSGRGKQDYWILRISSNGVRLWDKRFGGSSDDVLEEAITTPDGGFLLGGSSVSGKGGDKTESSRGKRDYWVVKVSSTGVKEWDRRFGGSQDEVLSGLAATSDGKILLAGTSASGKSGDKTQPSQGKTDFWIVQLAGTGAMLWDKRYGGAASDDLRAVLPTTDGGYLLGGRSASGISGDKTQPSQGATDYWIVKLTGTGEQQWDQRYGGAAAEDLRMLLQTADGGYLLGGRSASGISGDKTQPSQGLTDYWIVKVDAAGILAPLAEEAVPGNPGAPADPSAAVADSSPEKEESMLVASPNPFTHTVRLQFTLPGREQVSLKVYDAQGLEVADLYTGEAKAGRQYTYEWQAGKQKAGIYIIKLTTSSKAIHRRVLHVR